MKKHKLAFIDTEMTGLDPDSHELISVGVVLASQDWSSKKPVFDKIESFELKIKPEHIETADPVSLKINKYDPEKWTDSIPLSEAMKILGEKTRDCVMVAHNVAYDHMFLEKAFKKAGVPNGMHYHKLDTISIAFAKVKDEDVDRFSLQNLADHFGIVNENPHTALSDAETTFMLYKKLLEL